MQQEQLQPHPKHSHSFSKRPSLPQLLSYLIVLLDLIVFATCQASYLTSSSKVPIIVIFSITYTALILAALITSMTNPIDRLILSDRLNSQPQNLYCQSCQSAVHNQSRHCRICNICVQQFDHHCIWINNCVGKHNYKSFFVMICSVAVNFIVFVGSVIELWKEGQWKGFIAQMVVNWVCGLIMLGFTGMILALIIFHIFLNAKGVTTYQYLTKKAAVKISAQPLQHSAHQQTSQQAIPRIDKQSKKRQPLVFDEYTQSKSQSQKEQPQSQISIEIKQQDKQKMKKSMEQSTNMMRNKSVDYTMGQISVILPHRRITSTLQQYPQVNPKAYHSTNNQESRVVLKPRSKLKKIKQPSTTITTKNLK